MPELRHLRYFVAVAEELNFSRAARRLWMAQPPLSVAIRQLEEEIGTALFRRSSREVALTEAGRVFLDGARRILADVEQAVAAAQRAGAGELGRVRVGFSVAARFETLPSLGRAFRSQHADVELLTEEMWNARMPAALHQRAIDVAVALCAEPAEDLASETIRRETVVALLSAAHPLAHEDSIGIDALADEAFILFTREVAPRLYDTFVSICRRGGGFEPRIHKESFHTIWELHVLDDTAAVALAPESVRHALPSGVVAVPLAAVPPLETSLMWRPDDLSPTLAAFRVIARDLFAAPSA